MWETEGKEGIKGAKTRERVRAKKPSMCGGTGNGLK